MERGKPLTTGQIARLCFVSGVTVFNWIREGKLKAYTTPGGHYRILPQDFQRFVTENHMPLGLELRPEGPPRVLLVDDERVVIGALRRILYSDEVSYEVESASSGFDAGAKVASFKPDLLILDLMMPGLNGFEVCKQLKENPETSHIKVLVVTGYPEDENVRRALDCGAEHVLAKPFRADEVRHWVQRLLGKEVSREGESVLSKNG